LSEAENYTDKFLKSILGSGMFDSPTSPNPEEQVSDGITVQSITWHGFNICSSTCVAFSQ
jgi:hypothetical protein